MSYSRGSAVAAIALLAVVAEAQETPGPKARLDISTGLELTDNADIGSDGGDDLRLSSDLAFGFDSETKTERFSFLAGAGLQYSTSDGTLEAGNDPFARLSYRRDGSDALLSTRLSYSKSDVTSTVEDPQNPADNLIVDDGQRRILNGSVGLEFGREGPVGANVDLGYADQTYTGTTDPDLYDSTTRTASTSLRFDMDPRVTARVFLSYSDRETTGDGIDRTSFRYGVGADLVVTSSLTVDAQISHDRIDLEGGPALSPTDRSEEGSSLRIGATQELPNGSLNASFSSEVGDNGRRQAVRFGRNIPLATGTLGLSLGASKTEGIDGTQPLYGLSYSQELPRGTFSAALDQSVTASNDSSEVRNTNLTIGYRQDLNTISNLSTNLVLRDSTALDDAGDDLTRMDLAISYRRKFVDDWNVVGTYSHLRIDGSDREKETSNTLFIGLEKSIRWTP